MSLQPVAGAHKARAKEIPVVMRVFPGGSRSIEPALCSKDHTACRARQAVSVIHSVTALP